MNISFENVNKLIILNYLYDNFKKRTGEEKSYTNIYLHTQKYREKQIELSTVVVHGRIPCLFCCCCLLTKVFGFRAKLFNYSRLQNIQTNYPRSSERSLGLPKVRESILGK